MYTREPNHLLMPYPKAVRFPGSSYVVRLASSFTPVVFHLNFSGDSQSAASGLDYADVAVNERCEAALLYWTQWTAAYAH